MSHKKALPKEQAPAIYWRIHPEPIADALYEDFARRFGPGPIHMPKEWHQAFIALLPKPQKPPTTPGNLRPISVLPAVSKLLARIAAQRLRPLLEDAMKAQPQYAYLISRQTTDALDRAYAHSQLINKQVASIRPDPFAASKRHSTLLRGGDPVVAGLE